MADDELYDTIGRGYSQTRQPDERIKAAIEQALSNSAGVLNVGAGAGSYEPLGRTAAAVELSQTMIRQRPSDAAPVIQGSALHLPFSDESFGASLAILTLHHWPDYRLGLREMKRVAQERVVVLTWDPYGPDFWLTRDYFPEILEIDREIFPGMDDYADVLGRIEIRNVEVPCDCTDGFLGAYWRRPHAYLEKHVRDAMSTFTKLSDVETGVKALAHDLNDGTWKDRNHDILDRESIDLGYRLVIADLTSR
ncbi:MAG: SAM-dependent methyltransferase [Planctomycetota bacterium]|jgi:SAM-dependent methyltransferase